MERIYVCAEDVWEYVTENDVVQAGDRHEIASNEEFGIHAYACIDRDMVRVSVERDSEEVLSELTYDSEDCEDLVADIYDDYIYFKAGILGEGFDDYVNDEDRIYEREIELTEATQDFIDVACGQRFFDYEVEEIKDYFLDHLSSEYDTRIYRPAVFQRENGEEYIEDYPYELGNEDEDDYKVEDYYDWRDSCGDYDENLDDIWE